MGSKISTTEAKNNQQQQIQKSDKQQRKIKRKFKNLSSAEHQFSLANTTPEWKMPEVKRKCLQLMTPSTSNSSTACKLFSNMLSIKTLQQSERGSYLAAFFRLFDDDFIQDFLWLDRCFTLCDKYLLAMIYVYFRRAKLTRKDFTRQNFFLALYIAHEIEEDDEELKMEIYPWALGSELWRSKLKEFLYKRNVFLQRMKFRAVVSRTTCDEIFDLFPKHPAWQRERNGNHGGAIRFYNQNLENEVFSPSRNQMRCKVCLNGKSPIRISHNTFIKAYPANKNDIYFKNSSVEITLDDDHEE
ncbi:speedy protein A-like isoform X1 [Clytia hemisphaerica]|uniref:Speedy protein n=1 Tax=Clytia hemisphaerica TaxID=252671 RepID=A0A7M5XCG5_9CNID